MPFPFSVHNKSCFKPAKPDHIYAAVTAASPICGLWCSQIQHAEMSIMRASFILTHRPGRKFKFMEYILASLDDDVAKVSQPDFHCSFGLFTHTFRVHPYILDFTQTLNPKP